MQSNVGQFLPDQFSKINSDKNIACVKDMELQNWVATLQGKLKIYNTKQPKDQMHLVSDSVTFASSFTSPAKTITRDEK